ncbi:hypothetical protein HY478_03275 [Candidatus Uhrbacteria bacterium]|nr:hypothetical protein [Candidatus Uhrbacteria bacterium]
MEMEHDTEQSVPPPSRPPLTRRERRLLRKQEVVAAGGREHRLRAARQWGIGLGIVAILGVGVWGLTRIPQVREVGDVLNSCVNHGGVSAMHWHPVLRIVINGEPQDIPEGIGISGGCMRPIHTHDTSGKLHIESPVIREFTLGQFFTLWEKSFSREQILDARIDEIHEIVTNVNGVQVDTFENTALHDGQEIVIEYREKIQSPQ